MRDCRGLRDFRGGFGLVLLIAVSAVAQTQPATPRIRTLSLTAGRGELLQFARDIQRVVVSEPKIADGIVVSPREVMVNAKGAGHATLIVWETGVGPQQYEVNVTSDSMELETMHKVLTGEIKAALPNSDITFTGNAENLVLSGKAATLEESKRAQALAETHSKKVVNLIHVPPAADPRQIMLQVKFASVDRIGLQELGFNLFSRNGVTLGETTTEQFQSPRFSQLQFQNQQFSNSAVNFADLLNIFLFRPDIGIGGTIRALQGRNLLQILAEPNLIVVEGKEASFLAGGEFPFPTLTSTTTGGATSPVVTVQFKKFGVQLDFTPDITASGAIHLKVSPQVSSLDFTNAVTLQGFLIPAISSRRADTEVVLKDGESFAIAGLIDNRVEQIMNKVNVLGDIPVLGQLFRSRSTKKTANELLVVITPRIVKPLALGEAAKLPVNIEEFLPPAEQEKAKLKKKKKSANSPEFVGPRGHEEPKQ